MKKIAFLLVGFCASIGLKSQNIDFESTAPGAYTSSNAVSGWTVSSQTVVNCSNITWTPGSAEFSVISTPVPSVPVIGILGNSPLGGTHVVQLNNAFSGNMNATKLSRTFFVPSTNAMLQFAIAGVWEADQNNSNCDIAYFKVQLKDQSGTILSCSTVSLSSGSGAQTGLTYSTNAAGALWTNWQLKSLFIGGYAGSNVTLEVITGDCAFGAHYGTLFFDAANIALPASGSNYCAGSNVASLVTFPGFHTYQWYAPITGAVPAPQGTLSTLVVNNPIPGATYTVVLTHFSGCIFQATYAIAVSNVSITSVSTASSCANGSAGSATVTTIGSGSGYTYTWTNASNAVVGSNSVVTNIPPGTYTVKAGALGSPGCGTYSVLATVAGGTPGLTSTLIQPYCGTEAYLAAPSGTNYQWYTGSLAAISASLGGTAPTYTLVSPTNPSTITVGYEKNGCRDSVRFLLAALPPGSVSVTSNPVVCLGATNGLATFSLNPAMGSPSGLNSYSVVATGSTAPYTATLFPTTLNTFTAAGLSAGGTYSVKAFDGSCNYALNFSVTPFLFNHTVSPSSATVCGANTAIASVNFTSPPGPAQYAFAWSPSLFLNLTNNISTLISPTVTPGGSLSIIYTVVITPSAMNCPSTKTIGMTFLNPVTPTISPIPSLCSNGPSFSVTVSPAGGTFFNNSIPFINASSGIVTPSLAAVGNNSFTYTTMMGNCSAKSATSFVVHAPPVLAVSGNTIVCEGQSTSLLANGASTYTWNGTTVNPVFTANPNSTTVYTLIGTNAVTNCFEIKTVTVTAIPYPTITIIGNTSLCVGQSATIAATGANNFVWSNGSISQVIVVSPASTTSYSVTGTSGLASCSATQSATVTVNVCVVGIESHDALEDVLVYPNPSLDNFNLKISSECRITLRDIFGKILVDYDVNPGSCMIDLTDYPDGIYLLDLSYHNSLKRVKLIKSQ